MNRSNCLRDAIRFHGLAAHRELLVRVIRRHRGNLMAIGWDLNVSHRNVRRHILWCRLWHEVIAARASAPLAGSDLLARALERL